MKCSVYEMFFSVIYSCKCSMSPSHFSTVYSHSISPDALQNSKWTQMTANFCRMVFSHASIKIRYSFHIHVILGSSQPEITQCDPNFALGKLYIHNTSFIHTIPTTVHPTEQILKLFFLLHVYEIPNWTLICKLQVSPTHWSYFI